MLGMKRVREILEGVLRDSKVQSAKDLNGLLDEAENFLKNLNGRVEFRKEYSLTSKFYGSVKSSFEEIVKSYNSGNIIEASEQLKNLIIKKNREKHIDIILEKSVLEKNTPVFRMRVRNDYGLYERKEMFHIPINKINNIANVRYSMNGYPCLYLGASLYVCWEEIRRGDIDRVNFVKMKPLEDILLYTTLCPNEFTCKEDVIKFYLFVLCTKKVDNDNDRFKYQYVIPELLLHSLIKHHLNNKNKDVWGIKYVSSRYFDNDGKFKSKPIFYNYVIPFIPPVDDGKKSDNLSIKLKETFYVSETEASYVERVYEDKSVKTNVRPHAYYNTFFWKLEQKLKAEKRLDDKD